MSGGGTGGREGAGGTGERVTKLIARAGICSRREAERLIAAGRVSVDGAPIDSPALAVDDPRRIAVDGEPLPAAEPARLFRYYKPRGLLVAERDPHSRATIYDHLPEWLPRVVPVGRLDLASEGLLLLTNDGALKRRLELPATGWIRRYRVRVFGGVEQARLDALGAGVTVEGVRYGPIQARLDGQTGANAWLTVALREGKNREVRGVMEHLGLKVNRLLRVAYGPFQLGNMEPGQVSEVPAKVLAEQLGSAAPAADAAGRPARTITGAHSDAHRRRKA